MNRSELIILFIAAIISVVKWMMERGKEESQSEAEAEHRRRLSEMRREKAGQGTTPPATNAEEERLRKFMEALGLPASEPPPIVRKPAAPSQMSQSEEAQPPTLPQPQERSQRPAPRKVEPVVIRKSKSPKPFAPAHPPIVPVSPAIASPIAPSPEADAAEAAAFAIRTPHLRQPRRLTPIGEESERLVDFSSRRALRSAFVMAEILGQPKGLQ